MMGFSPLSSPLGRGEWRGDVLMMIGCGSADIWVIEMVGIRAWGMNWEEDE